MVDKTQRCGAETESGDPCRRSVSDGGRCHQHRVERTRDHSGEGCFDCGEPAGRYGWCRKCNPLTGKQQAFVDEYVANGFNASRAGKAAGYRQPRRMGSENLSKPDIEKAIEHLCADRCMGADEALARLSMIARGSTGGMDDVDEMKARDVLEALRDILEMHGALDEDTTKIDWDHALEQFDAIFGLGGGADE